MRKGFILFILSLFVYPFYAQKPLSEEAQISILTSAPHDEEVFTLYGHAALRVYDPQQDFDGVFNYGIFDFSKPNFIYRFVKGETDYMLGINSFQDYLLEYQMRGSNVTEQVLNLTQEEKERIWTALLINAQPENRVYRYNFFFDNCATRLPLLIEKGVSGEVAYFAPPPPKTFREMINDCTRNHPWLTFGCDIVVGNPADRTATTHEMMFLPDYLRDEMDKAVIVAADGRRRTLVSKIQLHRSKAMDPEKSIWDTLTPLICGWILFSLIALITLFEWRSGKYYHILDGVLFFIAGIAGMIIFFLSFISEHPCMWPNWNILWLHPFHLIGVALFCVKKFKKAAYYYHFINFAALTLMLVCWTMIPQHLNVAFIPLIASLWLRSGYSSVFKGLWKVG
ncbi:DUF4105 domain-containing protein [Parabacteroides sp. PF5-9]|uniref:lipoprotein N-acyltransferase Lnb domain-containing protein n=1 Tax=Parabacteroides sp. PF5-9 TaxID=1742404 RepID=UPI00247491ED|nr:DUF4105 domain-containing protein [Parabacteroides sp. PF5-9]MDH6356494.1 hypothetical protein [Parabacteroides sp. PF5-9]